MIASLLTLSLVVGISTGLCAGYAVFRMIWAASRVLDDPAGFVFRLPGGVLIYGVKTTVNEPEPKVRQLRLASRIHAPVSPSQRFRKVA